jgi:hypothetical protein
MAGHRPMSGRADDVGFSGQSGLTADIAEMTRLTLNGHWSTLHAASSGSSRYDAAS